MRVGGSERRLLQRLQQGDPAAVAELLERHYDRLHRWLRNLCGHKQDAEDLAVQTFERALAAVADFRGESSLRTWLHRIAYHEWTHLRRRQHPDWQPVTDLDQHAAAGGAEAAVLLRQCLAQLSVDHRAVFVLCAVQGFTAAEAAQVLDVPSGTIKSRLHHARDHLKAMLAEPATAAPQETPDVEAQSQCG